MDDEVAEGRTEVECLEHRVGVTIAEGNASVCVSVETVGRDIQREGSKRRTRCFQTARGERRGSGSKEGGVSRQRRRRTGGEARRKSRTFSKPNCFSSAMETVDWTVSWATDVDVGVCCGVANGIHLAAFPIAIAGWRRGRVGRGQEGGGYQRHVDGDADDSVVEVNGRQLVQGWVVLSSGVSAPWPRSGKVSL